MTPHLRAMVCPTTCRRFLTPSRFTQKKVALHSQRREILMMASSLFGAVLRPLSLIRRSSTAFPTVLGQALVRQRRRFPHKLLDACTVRLAFSVLLHLLLIRPYISRQAEFPCSTGGAHNDAGVQVILVICIQGVVRQLLLEDADRY